MDAIEAIKRQGYADGLAGVKPPRSVWLDSSEFGRAYSEAWLEGSLAALASQATRQSSSQGTIRATFAG